MDYIILAMVYYASVNYRVTTGFIAHVQLMNIIPSG